MSFTTGCTVFRALAFHNKKEYDRAIEDYTEAIRLDPKNAFAFNNRAAAYEAKRDSERASADRDAARQLG
jgi:tetratricopeptide (TPR) repeat protein